MNISHKKLIILSGLIWILPGIYLMRLGLNLLVTSAQGDILDGTHPVLRPLSGLFGGAQTAVIFVVILCLFIGYLKGRYVLGKSAKRGVERIRSFPNPAPLKKIYAPRYYLLLGGMIGLGMGIKYLGINSEVRGIVDTIIGAALLNGSVIYFRLARELPDSEAVSK